MRQRAADIAQAFVEHVEHVEHGTHMERQYKSPLTGEQNSLMLSL